MNLVIYHITFLSFLVLSEGQYIDFALINSDETQKITISDAGDQFGKSMASSGTYLAVGSLKDDENGKDSIGSVALFRYNGTTYLLEKKIVPDDGQAKDNFGGDVALENDLLIVGSKLSDFDPLNANDNQGSAYIYRNNGTDWNFEAKLVSNSSLTQQQCGCTVAIFNALVYMTCAGNNLGIVHVFQYSSGNWSRVSTISAPDGHNNDGFGSAIAIDQNYVVIAADSQTINGVANAGAVYIFRKEGNSVIFELKLQEAVPTMFFYFGRSISLYGNRLVVGSNGFSASQGGNVYIYFKNSTGWFEETKLSSNASTLDDDKTFGNVVLLTENVLFISSPKAIANGVRSGCTYIYKLVNETWDLQVTWAPVGLKESDLFGCDLVYNGNVLVAGASKADDAGTSSGVAYYRQVFYTPTNFSFNCYQNYFEVRFAKQILSDYWYEVTMIDTSCNTSSTSNDTYVWYKSNYDQCGTSITYTDTNISSSNTLILTNRFLLRGVAVRQISESYTIVCTFNRNVDVYPANNGSFSVASSNSVVTKTDEAISTFQVEYIMATYTSSSFQTQTTSPLIVSTSQTLYVGIKEKTSNPNFKFVVDKCYGSMSRGGQDDMFFNNKCPLDPTFQELSNTNDEYNFAISAFYFTADIESPVYLNCWIVVCHNTTENAECTQMCGAKRKRRATIIEKKNDGLGKSILVVSNQIIIRKPISCNVIKCEPNSKCHDVGKPKCICNDNYVFSKKDNGCTNEGIFLISGLHLDKTWSTDYINKRSRGFLQFADNLENILLLLLKRSKKDIEINGIRVVSVAKRNNSLALDIMITCSNSKKGEKILAFFINTVLAKSAETQKHLDELSIVKEKIPFLKINSYVIDTQFNLRVVLIVLFVSLMVLISGLFIFRFFFQKYVPSKI